MYDYVALKTKSFSINKSIII